MKKHYTKILVLFCVVLLFTFISCGKTKNKDAAQEATVQQAAAPQESAQQSDNQTEALDVYFIDATYTIKESGYEALLQMMLTAQDALQELEEFKNIDLSQIMLSKEAMGEYARAFKMIIKFNNDGTLSLSYNENPGAEDEKSKELTEDNMFYFIDDDNCLYVSETNDFNTENTNIIGYFSDDFEILYITQYDQDNTGLIMPLELV